MIRKIGPLIHNLNQLPWTNMTTPFKFRDQSDRLLKTFPQSSLNDL